MDWYSQLLPPKSVTEEKSMTQQGDENDWAH